MASTSPMSTPAVAARARARSRTLEHRRGEIHPSDDRTHRANATAWRPVPQPTSSSRSPGCSPSSDHSSAASSSVPPGEVLIVVGIGRRLEVSSPAKLSRRLRHGCCRLLALRTARARRARPLVPCSRGGPVRSPSSRRPRQSSLLRESTYSTAESRSRGHAPPRNPRCSGGTGHQGAHRHDDGVSRRKIAPWALRVPAQG